MKKSYAKISYTNCDSIDYDYTICEWCAVDDNLLNAIEDMEGFDQQEFEHNGDAYPSVTIEPVLMTDSEFEIWFIENVEKDA